VNKNLKNSFLAVKFALWDLHLYLDTHPGDLGALALCKKYDAKYQLLKQEYEEEYGLLSASDAQGVSWLKNPWPWEKEGCGC